MKLAVGPKGEENFYITKGRPDAPSFAASPLYVSDDNQLVMGILPASLIGPSPGTLTIEPAITNREISNVQYDIAQAYREVCYGQRSCWKPS
jgi:hypothetical protein